MLADPLLGSTQVTGERDWVPYGHARKNLAGFAALAVQDCFDERGYILGTERPQRDGQVQARILLDVCSPRELLQRLPGRVLAIGKIRRDVNAPFQKTRMQGVEPFRDAGLASVDLLAAADETNDDCPVFMSVQV